MVRRSAATLVLLAASLPLGACGGGSPQEGNFDPSIAEQFVRDKVIADVQSDLSLRTEDLEDPTVTCTEEEGGGEQPTDEGVFTCDAEVTNVDGKTLGRERWSVAVEIDPQSSDTVVRSSERLASSIGAAPEPP